MARIFKCDRCGATYDKHKDRDGEYQFYAVVCQVRSNGYVEPDYVDLCEKCMVSLNNFMAGGEMDE